MVDVSVVVPSYRRPTFLARAIESVLHQQMVGASVEIVVVDNDPSETARPVVDCANTDRSVPIRYMLETRPGISHARNSGVAAARGQYIAFLDDDEEADRHWLAHLLSAVRSFGADAVAGPVYPRFDGPMASVDAHRRRAHTHDARMPTGTPLRERGIGNSMFDRHRCFMNSEPFDPSLGLSGGEDTLFMRQLTRGGRRLRSGAAKRLCGRRCQQSGLKPATCCGDRFVQVRRPPLCASPCGRDKWVEHSDTWRAALSRRRSSGLAGLPCGFCAGQVGCR